jgi:hypothetical protein
VAGGLTDRTSGLRPLRYPLLVDDTVSRLAARRPLRRARFREVAAAGGREEIGRWLASGRGRLVSLAAKLARKTIRFT